MCIYTEGCLCKSAGEKDATWRPSGTHVLASEMQSYFVPQPMCDSLTVSRSFVVWLDGNDAGSGTNGAMICFTCMIRCRLVMHLNVFSQSFVGSSVWKKHGLLACGVCCEFLS